MLGINREIQKIVMFPQFFAIQSQLIGYKTLLKITNTVSRYSTQSILILGLFFYLIYINNYEYDLTNTSNPHDYQEVQTLWEVVLQQNHL